jgi:hypothetical protein
MNAGIQKTRTLATALLTALLAVPLLAADRMSDGDVKTLLERIDHERDRFEDQLDGDLKRSTIRGPGGEVNVERYLDDLQENVDRLKARFAPNYSASTEVTTVLRQGSDIQRFMATRQSNFDGASEWNRLSDSLKELAGAYGTTMPLPEGQQARRLNDREVEQAADDLARSADRFKKDLEKSLKNDTSIDAAAREAAVDQVNALKDDAKRLKSTVGDGRPASGEAQAVLDRAARIRAASSGRTLSPAAQTTWTSVETGVAKLAQAFSLPARRP